MYCIKDQDQYKDLVSRLMEGSYYVLHFYPDYYPAVAVVDTDDTQKRHKVKWLNTERIIEVADWIKENDRR